MQDTEIDSRVTVERMKRCIMGGPSDRSAFRDHLRNCSVCRLTQYSGLRPSQHEKFNDETDCGTLCEVGFDLFVPPDLMREAANPRDKRCSTEGIMRAMGFAPDWSDL